MPPMHPALTQNVRREFRKLVPRDALVGRMTSRRQCPKCSRTYNILSVRPKSPGRCDDDGEPLVICKDDREDVVRERLRAYDELTRPILAHYSDDHILGDRSPAYIFEELTGILKPIFHRNGHSS